MSTRGQSDPDNSTRVSFIIDLDKNLPSNPVADDKNYSFSNSTVPNRVEKINVNWSIWSPWCREYWVWHSTGEALDIGMIMVGRGLILNNIQRDFLAI